MSEMTDRFRKAGVPRSCWDIKAEATGRGHLNEWAAGIRKRLDSREAALSVYVPLPALDDRKRTEEYAIGQETIEILARQAVVAGVPVKVVPFYQLLHSLEKGVDMYPGEDDPEIRQRLNIFDLQGVGLLVVPYLPTQDESDCTTFQYRTVVDFILGHIYEGGVVVIGGKEKISKRLQSRYPCSLERLLVGNSEIFGS